MEAVVAEILAKRGFRNEPSFDEVLARYPRFPRLIGLKIDVKRRGVHYTKQAEAAVDPAVHQLRSPYIFGSRDGVIAPLPESLLLRDGTSILVDPTPVEQDPYTVDFIDGRFFLLDDGQLIEEVDLWPKPAYYDKKTKSGLPMNHIVGARPQRLNVFQSSYCYFWADGQGCRFCDIVPHTRQQRRELGVPDPVRAGDVRRDHCRGHQGARTFHQLVPDCRFGGEGGRGIRSGGRLLCRTATGHR